ncbi:efflux RND transporter periplasmic adaptor subunit [Piscinibacter sp. XHJ-5]|uniref:efflux RND transporter periplasmic adaptor subunit n=1 Tax=Piscinibacter sp. XHJ-5 TaxID=3037797 RepID=UPI00245366D7|nr:efflux RND transporter periplasmic adaptor subunit [Piscinibacter sp. XHJ-5]
MKRARSIAGGVLALLLLAAGAWWFLRDSNGAVQYRTARIERGSLQATVAASGTVTPVTQVQVGTQVSGQIRELYADFNSEVKAGQLLALIDPESFQYKLRQVQADLDASRASVLNAQANATAAQAAVARATVDLAEAQRALQRNQELVAQNFISPAQLDTSRALVDSQSAAVRAAQAQAQVAQAQIASAQATVKQREALVAQAKIDIERTEIRSPVNGVVIKRSVELGQTVAASLQAPELFVIAQNLADMQVQVAIDEADISRVRLNQKASFTVDAFAGREFGGTVSQVRKAATNTQNVITYTVVVSFANADARLLPGMTANVRLITDTRDNVLKVPNAALRVRLPGVEPAAAAASSSPRDASGGEAPMRSAQAQERRGAGGGMGGDLRERLAELQLTPQQQEKIDAISAEMRPKMAALRELPAEERTKARERLGAELRARIAEQLTPEQKARYQAMQAEAGSRQSTRGRIYLLEERQPRAYNVRLGITDGTMTELIVPPGSPEATKLMEGAEVVVGTVSSATSNAPAARPAGPRMSF